MVDPIWTSSNLTRNHGYMVYDTLYGTDAEFNIKPQMVEGHTIEEDGLLWRLTLRPGLTFHDGEPVLARDCVASIKRWSGRDVFGQSLMAATAELTAPSDNVIQFRLHQPFPLLPNALAKLASSMCAIMPERLASASHTEQISEIIGSGPFRFNEEERVQGARVVYDRFEGYVPRDEAANRTAGGKHVNFDRVEWHIMPDHATAVNALAIGEVDWVQSPVTDLLPILTSNPDVNVEITDPTGNQGALRFNTLHPPFDNPEVRRAVLHAVSQSDFMAAVAGADPEMSNTGVGVFTKGTPMDSDAGMEALNGPRDLEESRRIIAESGYDGEPVVLLSPSNRPVIKAESEVAADLLQRLGMNVDLQPMDWSTLQGRRVMRDPVEEGGWNITFTYIAGIDTLDPASHQNTRGNGDSAPPGWPVSEELERLRTEWFEAPDFEAQKAACAAIQEQVFEDVPYIPLGQFFLPTAYRTTIEGIQPGFPVFYGVTKA
ncbi:ABC transporter substrate-binding protein [Psychromarinibacter halotolerans]|uniref:ABC transporter substrate-binding protein n=1 Tax=Psychromarinibacter halotolerans TaxID=1775175 RepID=UPI0023D7EA10|nr:ABC transporter substrate-binding protein [Psychromarinibacter halotolerans]MDF0598505.1 ABC transporter substrate-binding protein [Psychromarinibacter halotolerans]